MILHVILALVVLFLIREFYWKRRNLPPGPTPLPLAGNFLTIARHEPGYDAYLKWKKEYGSVYTVWLGPIGCVVLADYAVIRKYMVDEGDKFVDRFVLTTEELQLMVKGGDFGLIESSGALWREQRRFALHTLRDFGMGKNLMEEKILVEVDLLLSRLSAVDGAVNLSEYLDRAVGSVINNFLFGFALETEQQIREFEEMKTMLGEIFREAAQPLIVLLQSVPHLMHLPLPVCWDFKQRITSRNKKLDEFFLPRIDAHNETIDYNEEESSGFVEAFLKEQKRQDDAGANETYHYRQLRTACLDLWIAGVETTSNTLSWAVLYLLRNPQCQKRIHSELSSVMGEGERVTMADRHRLPYMNAVINETQRLCNLLVTNLMRVTSCDMEIEGHFVPKGTCVLPQICCVLYDEKIFPDPFVFNPDRFIAPDGSVLKIEQLIPFSLGKRACLGESLARMELFLLLSNLLLHYELSVDGETPSDEKKFGITMATLPYTCLIKKKL